MRRAGHPATAAGGVGPLGRLRPLAWAVEVVRGCNLRCGHCATRLFPAGEITAMDVGVWTALARLVGAVTPRCRVELANAGEPALHPALCRLARILRRWAPGAQLQMTTNGTTLASGALTYAALFAAGFHIVYVDMYAPRAQHEALARASGYPWYAYDAVPPGAPNAWTYHGDPGLRLIVLQEPPARWSAARRGLGRLGTFYNHLDWPAAAPFGLAPVAAPPSRRCSQPFRYVSVHVSGAYELCCQDFWGETAGRWGGVPDGPDGFRKFWLGADLQRVRRALDRKDRAAVPWCRRCAITFNRCDVRPWPAGALNRYWDGAAWQPWDPAADYPPAAPGAGAPEATP